MSSPLTDLTPAAGPADNRPSLPAPAEKPSRAGLLPAGPRTGWLAPDDQLPQRDQLLDPGFVARRIGQLGLGPGPIHSAVLIRAKYRIGESLRTLWLCSGPDQPDVLITLRAFPPGPAGPAPLSASSGAVLSAASGAVLSAASGAVLSAASGAVLDRALGAAWWVFPADRRLPHIARLMNPDRALARQLGLPAWQASTVAEYAPERSLTVRATDANGSTVAYLKSYAPGTVEVDHLAGRYQLVARWFAHCSGVATPQVLGTAEDLLALEALPGHTWAAIGPGPGTTSGRAADHDLLAGMGRAIAHLHDLPVATTTGLSQPFGRLRAERIEHSIQLVARARPDVAQPLLALADRLRRRPPAGEIVLLHGDCHPKNAVIRPGSLGLVDLGLVDLDQAGLGDPACDIASLIARLLHDPVGASDQAQTLQRTQAFLGGYRRRRPLPPPDRLRWHLAATLVAERAIRAVNRLNPAGLRQLARTVALATEVLDGGLLSDRELEAGP